VSELSECDYKHPNIIQEEFWKGKRDGNRTLFINRIPKDFVGIMYLHSELSINSFADHVYLTEEFDLTDKKNLDFLEDIISVKKTTIGRYIEEVNRKYWKTFYSKYKDKVEFEYKLNCDLSTIENCKISIGKPYNHYVLDPHNRKTEKDFYNDEI
jgi:hypothetical protein